MIPLRPSKDNSKRTFLTSQTILTMAEDVAIIMLLFIDADKCPKPVIPAVPQQFLVTDLP